MRVYRNSDGYIVTYVPIDVEAFDPDKGPEGCTSPLFRVQGFFEFDRSGNLRGMDNHHACRQEIHWKVKAEKAHCRDYSC